MHSVEGEGRFGRQRIWVRGPERIPATPRTRLIARIAGGECFWVDVPDHLLAADRLGHGLRDPVARLFFRSCL